MASDAFMARSAAISLYHRWGRRPTALLFVIAFAFHVAVLFNLLPS